MKKIFKKQAAAPILSLLFLFILSDSLYAQMFSVDDRERVERAPFTYSSLSVGWEFGEFSFRGNPATAGADRFDFNDGILKVLFENPGIDMYLGLAGGLTGWENQNYLNIGATLYNNFVLTHSERFWLTLPLQLNTDLKRIHTDGASRQFQQTAFQVGAGLGGRAQLGDDLNATLRIVPGIGFSNSQGAFVGGTASSVDGKARIILDNVLGENGIIFGYSYRFRRYNIDADIFDYDFNGHTLTVGITF